MMFKIGEVVQILVFAVLGAHNCIYGVKFAFSGNNDWKAALIIAIGLLCLSIAAKLI